MSSDPRSAPRSAPVSTRPATPTSVLASQHGLIGLLGSVILAIGAFGVGYLPERAAIASWPVIEVLRTTTTGAIVSKGAVAVGAVLLLRAWLLLGGDVRAGRITSWTRLNRMFWFWAAPLILAPPLFSQDVYSYVAQGNLMHLGLDPYTMAPSAVPGPFLETVSPVWLDTPAPYGPLFLLIAKLAVSITGQNIYLASLLLRASALVGVWLIARYLPRVAQAYGVDGTMAVWVGLMNPLVFMHFVSGAHNDALMVGLLLAGFAMALKDRPYLAITLIALAGTIKIPALVGLGFVGLIWAGRDASWTRRVRCWAIAAVVTAGVFLAVNAVSGLGFGWIHALGTPGMVRSWISPITSIGVASGWLVSIAGYGQHTETILAILRGLATLAVLAYAAKLLLRPDSRTPVRVAGTVLLLLAVFGPVIQPWYLLWGVILLAAAGFTRRELPFVVAITAALVVHGLAQSSATSEAVLQVADPVSAMVAIAAAVIGIMGSRTARAEILAGRARWANAPNALVVPATDAPPPGAAAPR
jgi:hypothetical protein